MNGKRKKEKRKIDFYDIYLIFCFINKSPRILEILKLKYCLKKKKLIKIQRIIVNL